MLIFSGRCLGKPCANGEAREQAGTELREQSRIALTAVNQRIMIEPFSANFRCY